MKSLYLVRHAKSSWSQEYLDDFERPLNRRGKRDAPFMGKVLEATGIRPDLIVTSPAARASATARMIALQLGYDLENIRYDENLYEAGPRDFVEISRACSDNVLSLMLVSHNPGLTMTANQLGNVMINNVPTSGIVGITFRVDSWKNIGGENGSLEFFEYPKKYAEH